MDRFIGKRIDGRYEINELLGVGGMASVYKAYDIIDDRIVAIKILKEEFVANDEFRRRFKNESKAIAVLSHPNIVKVYDVSFGDVLQYIVMECCEGITLKEYIEQKGVIDWEEATFFTTQILKVLEHAHEKGIVHRDIKPQNIMLLPDGNIKVTDFGIARFSRSEQKTITDKAIGSVHYISPEQARGNDTDGRADIYSVGVMLYEMTTGKLPFQADSAVSVAIMQLQNEPVKPSEINALIPKGLEQIILLAMQKEPDDRYQTAFDMLKDVEELRRNPYIQFNHSYRSKPVNNGQQNDAVYENQSLYQSHVNLDDEKPKKKSHTAAILSSVAAAFVILIIGILYVSGIFGSSNETISCPNFIGKTQDEIKDNDEYEDLEIAWEYKNDSSYAYGVVFKQTPESGTDIKQKTKITLVVSTGAEKVKIENVIGDTFEDAKETLEGYGFVVKRVNKTDEDVPENHVIQSSPEANQLADKGTTVTLYVSSGPERYPTTVPGLFGISEESAKRDILSSGLKIGDVRYEYSSLPSGIVFNQYPSAGASAYTDDSVTIYVSKGPEPTSETTSTTAPSESASSNSPTVTPSNDKQNNDVD